jgi:aspartyl-tRNA(Asn)/glutamyl-tRNA(Gln) amidotransferase subunit A
VAIPDQRLPDWSRSSSAARAEISDRSVGRARRLEPRLHAFVAIENGPFQPSRDETLAGMPYAAKDMFATRDHRPACGLPSSAGFTIDGYAEVLRRLDDAGAFRVGFTTMTELAYEPSGYNAVAPYARNPWNPAFIPGGSSSGSAVAVASGSVVLAVGSDTGGSIRIPAHCCGVTGWKSTWGCVNSADALPLAPFLDTIGLLARGASELAPAVTVLSPPAKPRAPVEHIVVLRDALERAESSVSRACQDGIDAIEASGATISDTNGLRTIEAIDRHALNVMQGEAVRTHAARLDDHAINPVLRTRLAKGLAIDDATLCASREARMSLARAFEESILGKADAAALPVMPICTPRFREVDPSSPSFSARRLYALSDYCRFVNMLGFPAIAFPVGFDDRGLPVALQLVGRPGRDGDLVALAARMQEKTDWHARVPTAILDLVEPQRERPND